MIEPLFTGLNDWHDFLRLSLAVASLVSLVILVTKFLNHRVEWNTKTKDYWYALLMWCIVAISLGTEGIVRDRPIGPTLVFASAAALVTIKGVLKKGSWGGT